MQREARMVEWKIVYTRQAQRDARKIVAAGLRPKAGRILEILSQNPVQAPPPFEKLSGDLEEERTVKVIRMWTHYE